MEGHSRYMEKHRNEITAWPTDREEFGMAGKYG